jgi:hypothetical protein
LFNSENASLPSQAYRKLSLAHDVSGEITHEMSALSGTVSSNMTPSRHEATERSRSGDVEFDFVIAVVSG